jgi:hypothetical protein
MVANHPGVVSASTTAFPPFRLDTINEYLWRQFIAPIGDLPASKHEPLESFPSHTPEASHGTV